MGVEVANGTALGMGVAVLSGAGLKVGTAAALAVTVAGRLGTGEQAQTKKAAHTNSVLIFKACTFPVI
jgi:hypothetical protein